MLCPVGKGLHHSSGRVIALGRLIQAMLFLLALRLDPSQPTFAPQSTYAILAIYLFLAAAIAAATWNNWWLDARMAGPAHAIDILMFSMLVLLTAGYTSPFFTFFMFILLSAAIRWGWRATALSATLLTLLFLAAGFLVIRSGAAFELQRFAVRTGHLVILSLLLIWFGASQRWIRVGRKDEELFPAPSLDESPVETGLRATMAGLRSGIEGYALAGLDRIDDWPSTSARLRSEHRGVVEAIRAADATAARTRIHDHISGYYAETSPDRGTAAAPSTRQEHPW